MSKLDELKAELDELNQLEANIVERVWKHSTESLDSTGKPLTQEYIKERVALLAQRFVKEHPNENPVLVGLMDGAVNFSAMLCEELQKLHYTFNYTTMTVSSYGNELTSGTLNMGALPKVDLIMRNVVIVDDVCDSGKTLQNVVNCFAEQHPKTLVSMVLVDKVQERAYHPNYKAFEISKDDFVIGCGLDYLHALREKTSIKNANRAYLASPTERAKLERKDEVIKEIKTLLAEEKKQKAPKAFFGSVPVNPIPAAAAVKHEEHEVSAISLLGRQGC